MTLPIQQKIASGQPVIAVNIGGHNPDMVEILARVGADIALIDCERTGVGLDSATELIRARAGLSRAQLAGTQHSSGLSPPGSAPPELSHRWQFSFRAALPVRAPSSVS